MALLTCDRFEADVCRLTSGVLLESVTVVSACDSCYVPGCFSRRPEQKAYINYVEQNSGIPLKERILPFFHSKYSSQRLVFQSARRGLLCTAEL